MGLSRANRRQIVVCDMVVGAIDACKAAYVAAGERIPIAVHGTLHRLDKARDAAAQKALPPAGEDGKIHLDYQETLQYTQALGALQTEIKRQYGGTVDARDYLGAVLAMVEDVRAQLPPGDAARAKLWFDMARNLQALLNGYEENENHVDAGVDRAEAFKRAMGW